MRVWVYRDRTNPNTFAAAYFLDHEMSLLELVRILSCKVSRTVIKKPFY